MQHTVLMLLFALGALKKKQETKTSKPYNVIQYSFHSPSLASIHWELFLYYLPYEDLTRPFSIDLREAEWVLGGGDRGGGGCWVVPPLYRLTSLVFSNEENKWQRKTN